MGRKLDLSGLTDGEAEHVLQVVQRDVTLRKKEEERLCELKQELDEEGSRCLLLSRQSCFNQRCCIRCCSPFILLLNPRRQCRGCRYNVCKACRVYSKQDKAWLCSACQRSRLLQTQSLEWFYSNVKRRFKRFGSSKVLKTLHKKQLVELTEGSAYEESIYDEGSVCGSDSTFYRQTEEHSMAQMLTVAMRVAEEAIDEAISKAELGTACQQKEAYCLQEHRGELIEELAKTIMQKIISRKKSLAEMKSEFQKNPPLQHNTDLRHHRSLQSTCNQAAILKHQPGLLRSHSAFSLLDAGPLGQTQESPWVLKKDGCGSVMSTWKSVDQLDSAEGGPPVLKSPDGNWIALQSAQLSRPTELTKRLVYSTLERQSGIVSACEGLGSDDKAKPEPDRSWGLQEIHRKMTNSHFDPQDSPGSRDSERNWKPNKHLLALLKRNVPAEIRHPSSSRRTSIIGLNFNVEGAEEEEEIKQHTSDAVTPDTLTSGAVTPDSAEQESRFKGDMKIDQELTVKLQRLVGRVSDPSTRGEENGVGHPGSNGQMEAKGDRDDGNESVRRMDIEWDEGRTENEDKESESDEEMKCRLYKLVAQSRLTYVTSTDDDLDKVSQSEEEWEEGKDERVGGSKEQKEENTGRLTHKLCRLEKEVGANQFSSTEDELDGIGLTDEQKTGEDEEDEKHAELAVKVWRLANQVNATQFSSTEDELDRAGKGEEEEEVMDEETPWKLQAGQAAQLCDLSTLIVASRFSPTEHHLYGVSGGRGACVLWDEASGQNQGRRESFGDLDVKMFDFKDDMEERRRRTSHEEVAAENVLGVQTKDEDEDEEDVEFDKIIGSMLMMTLEDMEGERLKDEAAKNEVKNRAPEEGQMNENIKIESGAESTNASEKTGSSGDPKSRGNNAMAESAVDGSDGEESKELEKDTEPKEERHFAKDKSLILTVSKTLEAAQSGIHMQVDDEQEDRRGKITSSEVTPTWRHAGGCESRDKDGRLGETADGRKQSSTPPPEGLRPPEEIQIRNSAVSLCNITAEVLKVLNATEDLLQGVDGRDEPRISTVSLPPNTNPRILDQQFSRLEENVYVAAGAVYSLEAELSDLEECARGICSTTTHMELSSLEEQVASAAAKVQQSELQICGISTRIAALRSAGLDVDTQSQRPCALNVFLQAATRDSSRQLRRRLPAPPVKGTKLTFY
ncbi:rab effector MyRIP [Brachionichthys hirsutus]|uniref:rab effector MyRIP n=1 Tax=Brachionichthys hirsutus TaxID=412623 RepID=UPI0036045751